MYYSPHVLFRKKASIPSFDVVGNPVFAENEFEELCPCRCDDANIGELRDDNGHVYRPSYKIVLDSDVDVYCGDEIKVMSGETLRGKGVVKNVQRCNWYSYVVIWV